MDQHNVVLDDDRDLQLVLCTNFVGRTSHTGVSVRQDAKVSLRFEPDGARCSIESSVQQS